MRSWILATRPKTLTAAVVPILVGAALAPGISWILVFSALFAAIFIQIATNLFNDAIDYDKGADTEERLGPVRVTQSGILTSRQVMQGGFICLGLSALFGIPIMLQGGIPIVALFFVAFAFAYLYTGGPFPLAYVGLGDLFVLLFFGWIAVSALVYLQTREVTSDAILAGTQIGFLATALIAVNNLRDIEQDRKVNKKTLAVRFGEYFSRIEITLCAGLPFLLGFLWLDRGYAYAAYLPLLTFPFASKVITGVWSHDPGKVYNEILGLAAALHLLFGFTLMLGIYFS